MQLTYGSQQRKLDQFLRLVIHAWLSGYWEIPMKGKVRMKNRQRDGAKHQNANR